ncbi:MAG: redoxin family protein [Devosia sp.]|jgi:peroxiredoxin|nr:peroxiredoxin [Alphaproteobacteria bacterium]MBU1562729.1 peroxiredoxin [Alphaproteobacteria bacterium]MBU2303485.1 peroxiredoxin [Alphaproteobacteria bacterium]MBU2367010.1 peroxiredoxin [Alphaproteobacteria bacterium]
MIDRGSPVPSVGVKLVTADGATDTTSDAILGTGLVVLFTVPGAFTPTCHVNHLPGFVANAAKLKAAGIDRIVCATVNDHHVVKAWGEVTGALGTVDFIADGNAELAEALGLMKDSTAFGMGMRFVRSALLIRDGVVDAVFVEDAPGVNASGAPAILMALEAAYS